VAVSGEYEPSPVGWVRNDVEHYERTGKPADGRDVVLLTTVGRRTGKVRKTPLMRVESQGVYAIVASMGGADTHPSWYGNVLAHPDVQLQDGLVVQDMTARELTGEERARWWSRACVTFPPYADYQSRTTRRIPVLVLEPREPK
jgi:deazaflavin-dependent oxidoreductase (nitroreductase family)